MDSVRKIFRNYLDRVKDILGGCSPPCVVYIPYSINQSELMMLADIEYTSLHRELLDVPTIYLDYKLMHILGRGGVITELDYIYTFYPRYDRNRLLDLVADSRAIYTTSNLHIYDKLTKEYKLDGYMLAEAGLEEHVAVNDSIYMAEGSPTLLKHYMSCGECIYEPYIVYHKSGAVRHLITYFTRNVDSRELFNIYGKAVYGYTINELVHTGVLLRAGRGRYLVRDPYIRMYLAVEKFGEPIWRYVGYTYILSRVLTGIYDYTLFGEWDYVYIPRYRDVEIVDKIGFKAYTDGSTDLYIVFYSDDVYESVEKLLDKIDSDEKIVIYTRFVSRSLLKRLRGRDVYMVDYSSVNEVVKPSRPV